MRRATCRGLAAIVLMWGAAVRAADGDPDPTFGSGGSVADNFGVGATGKAVAVQSDGRIVVVGTVTPSQDGRSMVVARYTASGQLDPTFNSSGLQLIDDVTYNLDATDVALQSDGKILALGGLSLGRYADGMVVRLDAAGAIDTSYGRGDGRASVGLSPTQMERLSGDRLLVIGNQVGPFFDISASVIRLLSSGDVDHSFGTNGLAQVAADSFGGVRAAVRADGRIVVAFGQLVTVSPMYSYTLQVARLLSDGAPDVSFGSGGTVAVGVDGNPIDVGLLDDERIMIAIEPSSGGPQRLMRLTADGLPDASFGSGGVRLQDFASYLNGIDVAPDGTTVLAAGGPQLTLARLLPNGELDPSFGSGGLTTTSFGNGLSEATDVVRQVDGKLLAVGVTGDASPWRLTVSRYLAAAPPVSCGDGIVQSGEDCDGGDCCGVACHFAAAGTTCRPSTNVCDPAEFCSGVSVICPADLFDEDADGDGRCDPCPSGGVLRDVKVRAGNYATPAGDDGLRVRASLTLPPSTAIDPAGTGLRLVLHDATGARFDITVPAGTYQSATHTGWKTLQRGSATLWRFSSPTVVDEAVRKITMRRDASGEIAIALTGRRGSFAVSPMPSAAVVYLSVALDPAHLGDERCGEAAVLCDARSSAGVLSCRNYPSL